MYEKGLTDVDYFSRLDWTFFTLYQLMTLDNWIDVARQIMDVHPLAWIPIILYVTISAFVISNLAIAIICDAIFEINADTKAEKMKMMAKDMKDFEHMMHTLCYDICDHLDLPVPSSAESSALVKSQHVSRVSQDDEKDVALDLRCSSIPEFRNSCGKIINNDYVQGVLVFLVI